MDQPGSECPFPCTNQNKLKGYGGQGTGKALKTANLSISTKS